MFSQAGLYTLVSGGNDEHTATLSKLRGGKELCKRERARNAESCGERERELTRTPEFIRRIFVHLGQMFSRLGQGGLTWWRQLQTQVGTTGRGDTAETSPVMPNLIVLLSCCYFPIRYHPSRPCSHATFLQEAFQDATSQTHFLLPLFIPCHTSLHHSPHLFLSLCLPIQLEAWCPAGMQQ